VTEPLEAPRSADELYLARGEEVPILRPIMTGDVFHDVDIPGVEECEGDENRLAIIVTHPCSMRAGPKLRPHLQVVRVLPAPEVPPRAWPRQFFDRMPLPELLSTDMDLQLLSARQVSEEQGDAGADLAFPHAAMFELRGRVSSQALTLDHRVACLSEEGLALLHQRMTHYDTRHAPRVSDLMLACEAVSVEAELQQEWNERLISPSIQSAPTQLTTELERAAVEFDAELSMKRVLPGAGKSSSYTLRDDLRTAQKVHNARRAIRRLIAARAAGPVRRGVG
jgi:hypothetical protein